MGIAIVRLKEWYLIWSSVVDAPLFACTEEAELRDYFREEYGTQGLERLPAMLERVKAKGTSSKRDNSAAETIWLNRAGPDEATLTIEGIYRHFCLDQPVRAEWIVKGRVIGGDADDEGPKYEDVVRGWDDGPANE